MKQIVMRSVVAELLDAKMFMICHYQWIKRTICDK